MISEVNIKIDLPAGKKAEVLQIMREISIELEQIGIGMDMDGFDSSKPIRFSEKKKIRAGLDVDGTAKLYSYDSTGKLRQIAHLEWLSILDDLGAKPGEMLNVELSRYQE